MSVKLVLIIGFVYKQGVYVKKICELAFFFLLRSKPIVLTFTEHLTAIVLIGNKVIVSLLGRLGQPIPFFLVGAMLPTERQIIGTEQLRFHRDRVQKLIVQLGNFLGLRLADTRHVERVAVVLAHAYIFIPMVAAFLKPSESFQLALGQYQIDLSDRVGIAPNVLDHCNACTQKHLSEVHLVNHTFDIWHTNLEGMVLVML